MSRKHVTDFRGEYTPNRRSFEIKDEPVTPNRRSFEIKDEPVTPDDEGFMEFGELNYCFSNVNCNMRKSLSLNDIATTKLDENKGDPSSRSNVPEMSKTKFVSMAEAIYKFQTGPSERFRTSRSRPIQRGLTRPQSPMLRCKDRARSHHILSQKEREELELEEIRKSQIKANPVPKCVIEGSKNLPEVQTKPTTVPKPFKLTEVSKKLPPSPECVINFKARPAPKHILEKPKLDPIKSPAPVTKPVGPKFHYKRANSLDRCMSNLKKNEKPNEKCVKTVRHGPVKPEPFSFAKRDEELKRKHEERIKRQLEEERKLASQFKAQSPSAGVKKRMQSVTTVSAGSSNSSENKENHPKFVAKQPVVLQKKPFKPVLESTQIIKPKPFNLATEKRASEREQFDKHIKEKEEENEKIMQQKEREQQEAEERARRELRAKLVHHPIPVPPLSPNLPEKPYIPLTVPETPKFVRRLKNK